MTKANRVMAWVFSIAGVAACGGAAAEPVTPTSAPANVDDQVAMGAKLYAANCAKCHGANGEGDADTPAVVGKTALPLEAKGPTQARKSKFHTAADVLEFVRTNMPPKKAGTLTDEQYAAIVAFDLKANGVNLGGKKVDATTASSFVLHP